MQSLETWKRVQKKNEKRRATGHKRVLARRANSAAHKNRMEKIIAEAHAMSKNPKHIHAPVKKQHGLFDKIKSLFSKRSQRGS